MRASLSPAPTTSDELLAFAEPRADCARPAALRYFRGTFDTIVKGDSSLVTVADRGIEQAMRARIAARFPDHGIFGEEFGISLKPRTWILDPINSTKNFVTGMPLFGTLIALVEHGAVVAGVITDWAGRALGCNSDGRAVAVATPELHAAALTLLCGASHHHHGIGA